MPQQNQEVRLPAVVGDRLLIVPDYQRPYAWGDKQLGDLWEDLDLLGSVQTAGARPHYAGTLVLRDVPQDPPGHGFVTSVDDEGNVLRHTEIVDGQQRLTTCFLLLDRVRRRLQALAAAGVEEAGPMAAGLGKRYGFVRVQKAERPRLRLGSEMNDIWVQHVLGDEPHVGPSLLPGQRRLMEARDYFDARLDEMLADASEEVQLERLRDLQGRVTHGLGLLVYEVETLADVGVIFETVNERGRGLSNLEKTKNYLLYLARTIQDGRADVLAEKINKAWSEIFQNLARESADMDEQLLRAHWLVTQNPVARDWKQMTSIKGHFDRSKYVSGATRIVPEKRPAEDQEAAWDRLNEDISGYVETLRRSSYHLAEMFDEKAEYSAFAPENRLTVRRRSAALRRSGVVAAHRPLLLAARLTYPADGQFYADLVTAAEVYSARVFVIEQKRTNAGEARLLRLAHDLYLGQRSPADTLEEFYSVLAGYADDDAIRATLGLTEADWYHRRGHKYFLYEYELSKRAHPEELDPLSRFTDQAQEQRTTEHILPQRPREDSGGDCWRETFTDEERRTLIHSLGNLVLTYDNSVYSNRCFDEKRGKPAGPGEKLTRCYAQAELMQERELAHLETWSPASIEKRQQRLLDWALERWPLPILVVSEPDGEDIEPESADEL